MSDTRARSEDRGRMELNWEAVDRFATACQTNDSVIAAFLGGSLASGLADEESDLDLYVVVSEPDYEAFLTRAEEFLRSWGDLVFSTIILNFENLGFDMVLFAMADGVEGELALATERNFMATHGGPHRVLADKEGLLAGVEFPLLSFDDRPSQEQVEQPLWSFWWRSGRWSRRGLANSGG